jgi:hypothetical protein
MKLIQTDGQKTYLTKFCQDISKVTLVLMVIAPLVKPESTSIIIYFIGVWISFIFFITGYLLESREAKNG